MAEVYCTFLDCIHGKPYDDSYVVCTKDHITLDERVMDIECGCPDADWEEPQTEVDEYEKEYRELGLDRLKELRQTERSE